MRCVILALSVAVPCAAWAGTPLGVWRTETTDKGASLDVRIEPCGDALCGTVAGAHNTKRHDWVGRALITGMRPDGEGGWTGGRVHAPDNDKTYIGAMWIEGAELRIKGCVAILCRSQLWTRIE